MLFSSDGKSRRPLSPSSRPSISFNVYATDGVINRQASKGSHVTNAPSGVILGAHYSQVQTSKSFFGATGLNSIYLCWSLSPLFPKSASFCLSVCLFCLAICLSICGEANMAAITRTCRRIGANILGKAMREHLRNDTAVDIDAR